MAREDSLIWMIIDAIMKWVKTRNAWIAIIGTIILFSGLAGLFAYQAEAFPAKNPNIIPSDPDLVGPDEAEVGMYQETGFAREGVPVEREFDLEGERIYAMAVAVSWLDEPDDTLRSRRYDNKADSFSLTVTLPDGDSKTTTGTGTNAQEETIVVAWATDWAEEGIDWRDEAQGITNTILVEVECTSAGDQEPFFAPFGYRVIADDGNSYSIGVVYLYAPTPE